MAGDFTLKKTVISGFLNNYNVTIIMVNSDIDIFCNYTSYIVKELRRLRVISSYFIEEVPSA